MRALIGKLIDSIDEGLMTNQLKSLGTRELIGRILAVIGVILMGLSVLWYIYEQSVVVVYVILFVGLVIFIIGFWFFRAIGDAERAIEKLGKRIKAKQFDIKFAETNDFMRDEARRSFIEERQAEIRKLEQSKKELETWLLKRKGGKWHGHIGKK